MSSSAPIVFVRSFALCFLIGVMICLVITLMLGAYHQTAYVFSAEYATEAWPVFLVSGLVVGVSGAVVGAMQALRSSAKGDRDSEMKPR